MIIQLEFTCIFLFIALNSVPLSPYAKQRIVHALIRAQRESKNGIVFRTEN